MEYINKISAVLSKALQISKAYYFNSENHFYENLHIETGYAVKTLKSELRSHFTFKKDQMNSNIEYNPDAEFTKIPNYILNTRRIKIGLYWLKEREYNILIYINGLKWYVNSINELRESSSPIYVSTKGIAKAVNCTYSEALNSMHKLELYFPGLWIWEDNFSERIHPESMSLTIKLPPRKQWKHIIEAKIIEMTGLADLKIEKPYYVDKEDMGYLEKLWKKGKKLSIATFAKVRGFIEEQNLKLLEGKERKNQIQEAWVSVYSRIIGFLSKLVDSNIISEVIQSMEIKALNVNDPEDRDRRLIEGLQRMELKYAGYINNPSIFC